MKAIDRKLLRDLARMKGQAFTIALVVAAGIGAFVAQLTTYESLEGSRQSYYDSARFADVFADVKRAPKSVERQLRELPGIADVETTLAYDVTLDIPNVPEPVIGHMIGLDNAAQPRMNRLFLRKGRFIEPGAGDEVLISESFAKARKLSPGDNIAALLNGKRESFRIVGIVLSPEFIYASRGGAIPDDAGYGVFWMDRERLAGAFDMEGAFNHVVVRLAPGASEPAVIDALDRVLEPYGAYGAHGRADQPSHKMLSQEINQQKSMASVFPTIFLGVASFLLNVVLSRQVATQREQIAALKALGYPDSAIAIHYLKLVLAIVFFGILMGFAVGTWLGYQMTAMYTVFFHFPKLSYQIQPWIPLSAAAISLFAAVIGALSTMRGIMKLAPAEAMRPPSPTKFRRMLLERVGLEHLLSPAARMIVRTLERRPFRTAVTTFGIASSVAIIVSGTFWGDAINYLIDVQFNITDRSDAQIVFAEPVVGRARYEVAHLPGVLFAEASRSVPVRLRAGHLSYLTGVSGLPANGELRRLIDANLHQVPLPQEGILLTDRLADKLNVKPGDTLHLEILEGNRAKKQVLIAGIVNDLIGLAAYMDSRALNRLLGEGDAISTVNVSLQGQELNEFYAKLKQMPKVATVTIKASALQNFLETSAKNILVFTAIVTGFAAAIAIGVVYNSARISLAERAWELASLRVLGFTRREVSALLLGELAIELLLAIPLGLWLGYLLSVLIVAISQTETVHIPVIIEPKTYAYAALTTLLAGLISALIVRHRVDHLDLVAVLKTRE